MTLDECEVLLLYRQEAQLTQCTVSVNSCYVSQGIGLSKSSNSKSDIQGHKQWRHSIGHILLVFHCN